MKKITTHVHIHAGRKVRDAAGLRGVQEQKAGAEAQRVPTAAEREQRKAPGKRADEFLKNNPQFQKKAQDAGFRRLDSPPLFEVTLVEDGSGRTKVVKIESETERDALREAEAQNKGWGAKGNPKRVRDAYPSAGKRSWNGGTHADPAAMPTDRIQSGITAIKNTLRNSPFTAAQRADREERLRDLEAELGKR